MAPFFQRSESESPVRSDKGQPSASPVDVSPSAQSAAAPSPAAGLSRADRRRRAKRVAARRRSEERSLSNERLESRIAMTVNVAGYENAVDFFVNAPEFQDQNGFRRAPHSPQYTVHGRAVVASDDGSDVYLRQVASQTQDLIVDTSSNFLNYKIIDDIDGRYQQLFVTNGTLRTERDPLRPIAARPYEETANNVRSEFQLTDGEVLDGTAFNPITGTIYYTQNDGTQSRWTYSIVGTSTRAFVGPGFSGVALPKGHIRPTEVGLLDRNDDDFTGDYDVWQDSMYVDWTDRPNPFNDQKLDASYSTTDTVGVRTGFTIGTPACEPTLVRFDPSMRNGNVLVDDQAEPIQYQVVQVAMPWAHSALQDGVSERQSLGIIPGTFKGELGAIKVTWSDGIVRDLPAFRADVNGVLRFNTYLPDPDQDYIGSVYKDSSWYFAPDPNGSGFSMGIVDVRGTIRTDGILELEFRKWNYVDTNEGFTDETGTEWEGFEYLWGRDLVAGPGRVVVDDVSYLTYTRDAEPNTATFFAGQTITREVTVDLLTPGSTVNIDSPIVVDPTIRSYFNYVTPERLQLPDIDLRATNVNVRATMTTPDRIAIGRSQVSRERLSIPPDDVNPYLFSPSMPSLLDREAPEPPIMPNGGSPEIRQAAAIAEVNAAGQVSSLVLLPGYEGYGYDPSNPPTVTISLPAPGSGNVTSIPATARALVGRDGRLTGFVITNPGRNYPATLSQRPVVTIAAPIPQTAAVARVAEINAATGQIVRIDVLDPGYRYHAPPRVIVAPPDLTSFGVQATARAVLDNEGRLASIEVVDPGWGYVQRPVVTIAAPSPIAMAERIMVDAEVRGNVYEIYVGDDFGTDLPRGLAKLSANGTISTQPTSISITAVLPPPFGQRAEDVEQQVVLAPVGGGQFPAGFSPVGVALSGVGIRQGTRVLAWNPTTFTANLPPLSVSASVTLPITGQLSARALSLYLEATTADVYLEGLVNVEKQSYLIHSPPAAAYLTPFSLTTRSAVAGIQSGVLEGGTIDITLGNDAQTPLAGSTAEHVVDLRTRIDSLRVRAGSSPTDPRGPYPYLLSIEEEDQFSLDAVAASSLPISLSALEGIDITSAVVTDGDFSINVQSLDADRTNLRITAPIQTRYGKMNIAADTVEIRNTLAVTSAAVIDGRQDVVLLARGGNLVLQGEISAPNDVVLEQVDRVDDIQLLRINTFTAVAPGDTVQRVGLTFADGRPLPGIFDPTGVGIEAVNAAEATLVQRGAVISAYDPATGTATLPYLYPSALDQFYSQTPLVAGGGVGTTQATVQPAVTDLLGGQGTAIARVAVNGLWIRDAQIGDFVRLLDVNGVPTLDSFRTIVRVNAATGELTLDRAISADATDIEFFLGTQWSRRVNQGEPVEFLDAAGRSLGTATVVTIDRSAGIVNLSAPVPVGSVTIRKPPTLQPIAAGPGSAPIQIRLSRPVRAVTPGEIDGALSRIIADEVSIIADGRVSLRTDANRLTATAGTGFKLSELNDIRIPLLASGGLVSLEALGVDLGPKGQNPVALTASLVDVTELVVNTPNGSARIDANTDRDLLVGDAVTIAKLGDRAPGMLAAGDVTIRSQSGNVIMLDAPIAGGNGRPVRVATSGQLPATATYLPGVPGLTPSVLSGAGSINAVGDRFWGTDVNGRAIQLAVGDIVLVKDQGAVRTATATVTAASVSAGGTRVTYTAANSFVVGQTVAISGLSGFNLSGVQIVAASPTTFTVATTGAAGTNVTAANGTATVTQFGSPTVDHKRENGVYRVAALGGGVFGSQRWQLVRDAASDTSVDMPNGTLVRVTEGRYANQSFSITYDSILPTLVERVGTNQLQFPELFPNFDLLEVGQVVNGTGIAPNSFITAIDPVARVVTLDVVSPGQVFDSGIVTIELDGAGNPLTNANGDVVTTRGSKVFAAAGDTITLDPDFSATNFAKLAVGQQVTGPGILPGSVIMRIDPVTHEIDIVKTLLGPAVVVVGGSGANLNKELTFDPRETDAPFTQYSQLEEGQRVQLFDSEARLLQTLTIAGISLGDRENRRVILDLPANPLAVTARIWSPGAVAPVLSGTALSPQTTQATSAIGQVPVGEVRPSSIVFRAANRLAGVRVGQLFRFVDAAGQPISAVPPQPVSSVTIRVALDGTTVEGDVTVGFNSLLTPAQLQAVRSAGGAAVEFLAPDQVTFGISAPRSVPTTWNSWAAANVFDGAKLGDSRYTTVFAKAGDPAVTAIAAIPPQAILGPTAVIQAASVATTNLALTATPTFFSVARVGQMVQFLAALGDGDTDNAFVPPLDPVTAGLALGQNSTVATMAPAVGGGASAIFTNLVVGQTVQFLGQDPTVPPALGGGPILGSATVRSFTAAQNILELSGTIPAGTVAIRRLNVATITAIDATTGAITLSEPTPRNAAQVRLVPNTVPLLRGIGTSNGVVAPYSPIFLWAQAGHTMEILDAAGTTVLASLGINDLDPGLGVRPDLDPVTGRIGLNGSIPAGGGLIRLGNLTTVQPNTPFFDLSVADPVNGDIVEFLDAVGTVLPGTGRITRLDRNNGGVLLDVAVPAGTASLRLPIVATVGIDSQFFAFAQTGKPVVFRDTAGNAIPDALPTNTITALDSGVGTVRFAEAIPLFAASVEVNVPDNIVVITNNDAFFDLAREGDTIEFADAAGGSLGTATIRSLNSRLGQVTIELSVATPTIPPTTSLIRLTTGNIVTVSATTAFFTRAVVGNRVQFLNAEDGVLGGVRPFEATISSLGRPLADGTREVRLTSLPPSTRSPVNSGVNTSVATLDANAPWFSLARVGDTVQFLAAAGNGIGQAEISAINAAAGTVTLTGGVVPTNTVNILLVGGDYTQLRVLSSVITLPNFSDFSELVVGLEVFGDNLILPVDNRVTAVALLDRDGPGPAVADTTLVDFEITAGVSAATPSAGGQRVTYTLNPQTINRLVVGQRVSVSGLPRFNVTSARVIAASSGSFTVETTGAIGAAVTGAAGVATVDYLDRAAVGDTVEFLKLDSTGRVTRDSLGQEVVLGTSTILLAQYPNVESLQPGTIVVDGDHTGYASQAPDGYVMRTLTRGFMITAVDPVARTITTDLSPLGATTNVGFGIGPSARYPAASTLRLDPGFTNYERLFVGQPVYGAGIDAGAVIVSIDRVVGTVTLTPGSVATERGPIRVTQRDWLRSGFYPEQFDDWVELEHTFNDFNELKAGQRAELFDTFGGLLKVVTVSGVDGLFRTVGFENGSLLDSDGDSIADQVHTIRFLSVSSVRFGVLDGVGSGISEILLEPVGYTPISVTDRTVTTNIGSDLGSRTATFVASTDGRTNDATGSLGKMLGVYQANDTRRTQVDVSVTEVDLNPTDGTVTLRLDPLFTDYTRLETVIAERRLVYGSPRLFTDTARVRSVDRIQQTVTLEPDSLTNLAIEDVSRVTYVTLPAETTNPEQDQRFQFWSWMTGNIQLLQELPAIRKMITIDGALVSNNYAGAAGPAAPAPTPPAVRLGPVFIDGQRIARTRTGQAVVNGQQINGFDVIDSGADSTKIARLSVGGFQQGSGIKVDGASHVVVESVNVGRTTTNSRFPNNRGITITGRYLQPADGQTGSGSTLRIATTDRVVFNTLAVGQQVRLLQSTSDAGLYADGARNVIRNAQGGEFFTIASLDATNYVVTFAEQVPDRSKVKVLELAVATNNTVLNSTVVGGLTAGIYIDAGATRTYVVGGSVGTSTIDNQVGIFVGGEGVSPYRPAPKETFIGANPILPAQPLILSAAFSSGSREITLPATLFNTPLIGLGLFFENPRILPPVSERAVIERIDSARGVAYLSEPASYSTNTGFKIGHVFERVDDGTGEFLTLQLPESIPLDDIFVGQTLAGTNLAPAGVAITSIDRETRRVRISEPYAVPGFGVLSIAAPAQTVVRGNRTGILLKGEDSHVTNAAVFENTRSGIDVVTPGQQIGSTAVFSDTPALTAAPSAEVPLASWPTVVTLGNASRSISLPSTFTGRASDIAVGAAVYGPGIPAGATVTKVTVSTATGRLTAVELSARPFTTPVVGGTGSKIAQIAANSWWFREVRPGQQVQFRNASGSNLGTAVQVGAVDVANGKVTLAGNATVPVGAVEVAIAGSRTATISFGVSVGGVPQVVPVADADRPKLFVGQDMHGAGLPEYSQIAGLRLTGDGDYISVSAPRTTLSKPYFEALAAPVVMAERTSASNRIFGNGEYGIIVRHQGTGDETPGARDVSKGLSNRLPTRIFANYFGMTDETNEVAPNRIAPIWYTYEASESAWRTPVSSVPAGSLTAIVPAGPARAEWFKSAAVGQPLQFVNSAGTLLNTAPITITSLNETTGEVGLSAAVPAGAVQMRKQAELPSRHRVSGRVSRVDLLGNKFGVGTVVNPPASPINPVPPGDPIIGPIR
jgi:hypothetical protein